MTTLPGAGFTIREVGNMYEIAEFINRKGKLATAIQKIDYPIHKGKPNPSHGKFYFVGSVPINLNGLKFDTETEAIEAARKEGVERLQDHKCKWVELI